MSGERLCAETHGRLRPTLLRGHVRRRVYAAAAAFLLERVPLKAAQPWLRCRTIHRTMMNTTSAAMSTQYHEPMLNLPKALGEFRRRHRQNHHPGEARCERRAHHLLTERVERVNAWRRRGMVGPAQGGRAGLTVDRGSACSWSLARRPEHRGSIERASARSRPRRTRPRCVGGRQRGPKTLEAVTAVPEG
jgi:hypothetical protein